MASFMKSKFPLVASVASEQNSADANGAALDEVDVDESLALDDWSPSHPDTDPITTAMVTSPRYPFTRA